MQQLKATSAKATAIKLPNLMANAGKVVDFLSNDNNRAEQKRNSAFIAAQHKAVAALLKKYKIK
jgi:hypothetical protein